MQDINNMNTLGKIKNYSQINLLKEIWIGDTYPETFYNHFDNKTQDIFSKITEMTKKELNNICKILKKLNVNVVRPQFNSTVDRYMDAKENLIKPPMCPADWAMTIDDTLYINPQYYSGVEPFQHAIDSYKSNNQKVVIIDRAKDPMAWVNFPCVVRMGKDIFIDYDPNRSEFKKNNLIIAEQLSNTHRVHVSKTGDHSDGVFCPLKDKQILSSFYKTRYEKSFPDWNITFLDDRPTRRNSGPSHNNNWWLPGAHYANYNNEIIKVAENWLGNPWETIFSVNCILVDEKNILVIKEDEKIFKHLEGIGMTPHHANFDMCYFWDSGLHCLSSDVYREGTTPDYWPNRGANGVYFIDE
jgi:hypothetical protein